MGLVLLRQILISTRSLHLTVPQLRLRPYSTKDNGSTKSS